MFTVIKLVWSVTKVLYFHVKYRYLIGLLDAVDNPFSNPQR